MDEVITFSYADRLPSSHPDESSDVNLEGVDRWSHATSGEPPRDLISEKKVWMAVNCEGQISFEGATCKTFSLKHSKINLNYQQNVKNQLFWLFLLKLAC